MRHKSRLQRYFTLDDGVWFELQVGQRSPSDEGERNGWRRLKRSVNFRTRAHISVSSLLKLVQTKTDAFDNAIRLAEIAVCNLDLVISYNTRCPAICETEQELAFTNFETPGNRSSSKLKDLKLSDLLSVTHFISFFYVIKKD